MGKSQARALWDLGLEAVDTVCGLIEAHGIDCELKQGNLHVASKAAHAQELEEYASHLQEHYDYAGVRYVAPDELAAMTSGQGFHGGLLDPGARHLHPLNYALGLARAAHDLGASLHEGSRVLDYRESAGGVQVRTGAGRVKARFLVLGCNGYLERLESRAAGRDHADQQLHARHRTAAGSAGAAADPRRRVHERQPVRDQLLETLRRQPPAVRRWRELQPPLPRRHQAVRAQVHAADLSRTGPRPALIMAGAAPSRSP